MFFLSLDITISDQDLVVSHLVLYLNIELVLIDRISQMSSSNLIRSRCAVEVICRQVALIHSLGKVSVCCGRLVDILVATRHDSDTITLTGFSLLLCLHLFLAAGEVPRNESNIVHSGRGTELIPTVALN